MRNLSLLIALLFLTAYQSFAQQCYAVYADADVVIIAMEQKLYRSTDNAKTFTSILPAGEDNIAVRCIAKVNNTIIIGGLNGDNRIFRSTDKGVTWSVAKAGMPDFYGYSSAVPAKALTVGSKVFMGGTNFFRVSEDEGLTWKKMTIDPATGAIGYTGDKLWHSKSVGGPGLSFSNDMGTTWQVPPSNPAAANNAAVGFAQIADTLVVLTAENGTSGIKRTVDAGKTWQTIANTLQLGLDMIQVNGELYACDYNGFHKSNNGGLTWTKVCDTFKWHTYGGKMHVNGDDIWMASANGAVRYSIPKASCEVVSITPTLNLNKVIWSNTMEVYPNPANAFLTLTNAPLGAKLEITDVDGRIIYKENIKEIQATINTENFVNGLYFIQIEYNGTVAHKKFLVSK